MSSRGGISGKETEASEWVRRFLPGVRPGGRVLDVGCGGGRHLSLALASGYVVTGIDKHTARARDRLTREHGRWPAGADLVELDLEDGSPFPVPAGACDGVIVTNYLWRPILAEIVDAVALDTGVLIYETFAVGNERFGRPSNPDFLLKPGELMEAVAGRLTPIAYEHVSLREPERSIQRIVAVGKEHGWLSQPPWL